MASQGHAVPTSRRGLHQLLLLACLLLAGCAGDSYAPVSDRSDSEVRSGSYQVVRGDTLYSIAFRQGVDHRQVATWNGIKPPYVIYPGQTLRLSPPAGRLAARTPAPAPRPAKTTAASPATRQSPPPSGSPPAHSRIQWHWPTSGEVSKQFSADGDGKQGINIDGAVGDAVKAAAAGRVVYSGSGLSGYGNLIILMHAEDYLTAYGYNRELLVDEGASVDRGDVIARMGRNGNKPMLHFELRRDGRAVDPLGYLPRKP